MPKIKKYDDKNILASTDEFLICDKDGRTFNLPGSVILNLTDNGEAEVIVAEDADAFDANKEGGYPAGAIVSYINELGVAPFNELAIYVSQVPIEYIGDYPDGYVPNPEQDTNWVWQGQQVAVSQGTTANSFVESITQLQLIPTPKNGHTIGVKATASIYKFSTSIIYTTITE